MADENRSVVLRIKRKRTEDPLDALLVAQVFKKPHIEKVEGSDKDNEEVDNSKLNPTIERVFKFVGSVPQGDVVKKKDLLVKIQKQSGSHEHLAKSHIHDHQTIQERLRQKKKLLNQESRFKVISSHRENEVESSRDEAEVKKNTKKNKAIIHLDLTSLINKGFINGQKENVYLGEEHGKFQAGKIGPSCLFGHLVGTSGMCQESDICSVDQSEELGVEDDVDLEVQRLLSVYDLVKDDESRDSREKREERKERKRQQSEDVNAILCNSVKMIREKLTVSEESKTEETALEKEGYVYDFYYASDNYGRLGDIVEVLPFDPDLVHEALQEDFDEIYDDEDDSNDESNWRNDYPDEDEGLSDSSQERRFYEDYGFDSDEGYRRYAFDEDLSEDDD
ncbi:unnamed protein product [Porites evermanni]|uniref:Probable RNA polymerase II nuclear localization protein SLC7A6OS n=1 Tax=Porites evermanni TaxID=104178 RepID=A0ABN8LZN6_9CNID|nr:unnamed protein product [Porites evermanni]